MNQKNENQLNLALLLPENLREKTGDLNTGFNMSDKEWELIIRHSGELSLEATELATSIKELSAGFALVKIREELIDRLANLPEVIFLEKPKRLYTELDYSVVASCITPVWNPPYNLSGKGVLIGIIDSGIDYRHPDFNTPEGNSRIIWILDENTGREYTKAQIEEGAVPVIDIGGHGTHVTGIAAGNGRASDGKYRGVAYESEIIVVNLGRDEFFNTARLMEGVDYVIKKAESLNMPVAINLSIGNNYGAHNGNSLLENYLNQAAQTWKTVIVAGSGNEANKNIHIAGKIGEKPERIELVIGENETSMDVQLWKEYGDEILLNIIAPDGRKFGPVLMEKTLTEYIYRDTGIFVYFGEPQPYTTAQEIFIQFIPINTGIESGIWQFELVPVKIISGEFDMWLPRGNFVNNSTGFVQNTPDTTLTIPSTAYNVITVGAYDAALNSYGAFSGRGYTRRITTVKPDLVAPGVGIVSAAVGGGYVAKTGTSMAAPFVTGSAALLMEWGIVRGNDPFMYGEKIKAYLIKGARPLPGETIPSPKIGWGALCLGGSFDE